MKDWVKEWYNDQFDNIDFTPSSNVWDNISQTMEDWPKHWYASNVGDLNTAPRQSTWEQLQENLAHERRIKLSNRISYATASVFAVLLLFLPFNIEDSSLKLNDSNLSASILPSSTVPKINQDLNDKLILANNASNTVVSRESSKRDQVAVQNGKEERFTPKRVDAKLLPVITSANDLDESKQINVASNTKFISLPVRRSEFLVSRNRDLIQYHGGLNKGGWLSFAIAPQISSLNNPMSQNAFDSEDQRIEYTPSLTYEIAAGYKFNRRNGVKLAMLLNNKKSLQVSTETDERSISLNYLSIGALYTSSWQIGQSRRLSLNTEAGLIAGISTKNDVLFNNERIDYLEEGYGKFDAGVIFGASLATKLNDHWSLSTGINTQVGVLNIFKGTDAIPEDYFKTSTQSIGLNVGVAYNL